MPHYLQSVSSHSSDHSIVFEILILLKREPVFILQLKNPADVNCITARQTADAQIRERMGDLAGQCPIPTLHAVSAMGTKLCFYRRDTTDANANIIPLAIPRNPTRINDTAPAASWDCNVLEAEGEAKLRAVVKDVMDTADIANE